MYCIPEWFYVNKAKTQVSTAAGRFDPNQALTKEGGWVSDVANIIPEKKKILISDWTIEQSEYRLAKVNNLVRQLLAEGFEVYANNNDKIIKLTGEPEDLFCLNNVSPIHKNVLFEQACGQHNINADDLIILDYEGMGEFAKSALENSELQVLPFHYAIEESKFSLEQIIGTIPESNEYIVSLGKSNFEEFINLPYAIRGKITRIYTDYWVELNYLESDLKTIFYNVRKFDCVISNDNNFLRYNIYEQHRLNFYIPKDKVLSKHEESQLKKVYQQAQNLIKKNIDYGIPTYNNVWELLESKTKLIDKFAHKIYDCLKNKDDYHNCKKHFIEKVYGLVAYELIIFKKALEKNYQLQALELKHLFSSMHTLYLSSFDEVELMLLDKIKPKHLTITDIAKLLEVDSEKLASVTSLEIDIDNYRIDSSTLLKVYQHLPNLDRLILHDLEDLGDIVLSNITSLELHLTEFVISVDPSINFPNLVNLRIITDMQYYEIYAKKPMPYLTTLFFPQPLIINQELYFAILANSPNLQKIDITIEAFNLFFDILSAQGIHKNLTKLTLRFVDETDIKLGKLLDIFPNLEHLSLSNVNLTVLKFKTKKHPIKTLVIEDLKSKFGSCKFSNLLRRTPDIQVLKLISKGQIIYFYDCIIEPDLKLKKLTVLDMSNIICTANGEDEYDLSIYTDENIVSIAKACPNLEHLSLGPINSVVSPELPVGCLKKLRILKISFASSLSNSGFKALIDSAPNLEEFRVPNIVDSLASLINPAPISAGHDQLIELDIFSWWFTGKAEYDEFLRLTEKNCPEYSAPKEEKRYEKGFKYIASSKPPFYNGRTASIPQAIMCHTSNYEPKDNSIVGDMEQSTDKFNVATGSIFPISANCHKYQEERSAVYDLTPELDQKDIGLHSVKQENFELLTNFINNTLIPDKDIWDDRFGIKQNLTMQAGKRYKIKSLTPNDKLIQLKLVNDIGCTKIKIEYCKDDNFYYISSDTARNIEFLATIDVPKPAFKNINNKDLKQIIEHCKFPLPKDYLQETLDGIDENSTAREKLEAHYQQRKGPCRSRVAAAIYQINKLKSQGALQDISARYAKGPTHAWIEIKEEDGNWQSHDLGGYPAEFSVAEKMPVQDDHASCSDNNHDTKVNLKQIIRADKSSKFIFARKQKKSTAKKPEELVEQLLLHNKANRLLIKLQTPEIATKFEELLLLASKLHSINTLSVANKTELSCYNPQLVLNANNDSWEKHEPPPPIGRLYDFLKSTDNKKLLINWNGFSAHDMVSANSVIDTDDSNVQGVKIDNTDIISIVSTPADPNEPDFMQDSSFVSRHDKIYECPYNEIQIQAVIDRLLHKKVVKKTKSTKKQSVIVNLYASPQWQRLLLGEYKAYNGKKTFIKGPIFKAIDEGRPLTIINPPASEDYQKFYQSLDYFQELIFYEKNIPDVNIILTETVQQFNPALYGEQIARASLDVDNTKISNKYFVVNAATFQRCFVNEREENNLLIEEDGFIQQHKDKELSLFITSSLNAMQLEYLLATAKKYNVKLNLAIAPGVILDDEMLNLIKSKPTIEAIPDGELKINNQFIVTNDPTAVIFNLKTNLETELEKEPLVINASELSDEDVLYANSFSENGKKITFSQKMSIILAELLKHDGRAVILTGDISNNLLEHLASLYLPEPYVYNQNKKLAIPGKLFIVSNNKPEYGFIHNIEQIDISKADIVKILDKTELNSEELSKQFVDFAENKAKLFDAKLTNIQQAIAFSALYTKMTGSVPTIEQALTACLSIDFNPTNIPDDTLDLSVDTYKEFINFRHKLVGAALDVNPFVYLESPAGYGKSSFVSDFINSRDGHLFGANDVYAWATSKKAGEKILFLDEANIGGRDWTEFDTLFNNPPYILVNNEIIQLSAEHKVIFAGNPISYGDRNIPQLFIDRPFTVQFPQMHPAFIYHAILKPILEQSCAAEDAVIIAKNIFNKYNLKHFIEPEKYNVTVRDLQFDALKYCAILHEAMQSKTKKGKGPQDAYLESDYLITPTRHEAAKSIDELLYINNFRRELSNDTSNALLYGGKSCCVLNGPPGVGKSRVVINRLEAKGYSQASLDSTEVITGKVYYNLPADSTVSLKIKILDKAFNEGAVVLVDEINAAGFPEDYLNSYLMGQDRNGNPPKRAGFTVIGTANSAGLKGRRGLSPALKSRSVLVDVTEYPKSDLLELTKHYFPALPYTFMEYLVDTFLKEQTIAGANPGMQMPTFRDYMNIVGNYAEQNYEFTSIEEYIAAFENPKKHKKTMTPAFNIDKYEIPASAAPGGKKSTPSKPPSKSS